ncbi:MAG TPA: hypothetical protein VHX17_01050 [Candidatus Cybelea sp.]|nr:hypothetical protein [Candidatus Cybelea sp.]
MFNSTLCASIAVALLAGCSGNLAGSNNSMPLENADLHMRPESVYGDVAPPRTVQVLHALIPGQVRPDKKKKLPKTGIYIAEFYGSDIFGYPINNKGNKKPICTVQGVSDVNDVGIDGKGNLIDPDGGSSYVIVYKGPQMCTGKQLALIADTVGQAADAVSADATTGTIAVSQLADAGSEPGSVLLCTIKGGCTTNLTNSIIYHAGGVAMSPQGDCWNDAKTSASGGAALVYWKGCKGSGAVATGFKSTYYGGMEMDNSGNLVVIDDMAETATVYSGCNPKCKVLGGPFALKGESFFGKLTQDNKEYIAVDRTDGLVDVYSYSTKAIKFMYSFDSGLSAGEKPDGIGINPRSKY